MLLPVAIAVICPPIGHQIPVGGQISAMATGNSIVWALDGARGLLFEISPN